MAWETVVIENSKKCRGIPTASVGFGRISLNLVACELLGNFDRYKYAELLTDPMQPSTYGIRFLYENTENSIAIKRKTIKGKIVGGIDIASKHHMEKIFGMIGTQTKTTHFSVKRDKNESNILVLTLAK